ncbi:MAG: hypothetical protein KAJ29_07380 [Alphaproteobacteria bacterium]|nr:hypothetical protein [Alphaproteobacteria bacterium]
MSDESEKKSRVLLRMSRSYENAPSDERVPDKKDIEKEDLRAKKLANDLAQQRMDLQEKMFKWIEKTVSRWLIFIVAFFSCYTLLNMFLPTPFVLDKEILMTLLATTTLNILGLPYVVARYLFGYER